MALAQGLPNPQAQAAGGTGAYLLHGPDALATNPAHVTSQGWVAHWDVINFTPPVEAWHNWSPMFGDMLDGDQSLLQDSTFAATLWEYDGVPIQAQLGSAFALGYNSFAASGEVRVTTGALLEHGSVLPRVTVWDSVSYLFRIGQAQPFGKWTLGQSLNLHGLVDYRDTAGFYDPDEFQTVLENLRDSLLDAPDEETQWHATLTLAISRTWKNGWDASTVLREIGRDSAGHARRPYWDFCGGWDIPQLHATGTLPGQLRLGAQLNDVLGIRGTDPFLRRLGLGMEMEQGLGHILAFRGSLGVHSGWPTAGVGLMIFRWIRLDLATWAEETGRYVGQKAERNWDVRFRLGA